MAKLSSPTLHGSARSAIEAAKVLALNAAKERITAGIQAAAAAAVAAAQARGETDPAELVKIHTTATTAAAVAAATAPPLPATADAGGAMAPPDDWEHAEDAVRACEEAERAYHAAQVPVLQRKTTVPADGKKKRKFNPGQRGRTLAPAEADVEEEGEEEVGGEGGGERERGRAAAAAAAALAALSRVPRWTSSSSNAGIWASPSAATRSSSRPVLLRARG